ncbi:DgyrCDS11058 [Dimorphilus gyrociliatus]|uniref:protein-tyrosine-phosphatase n=1 Tax=Dimorphilus gyrociliatus TaxID=2664684 RepID=A0A7I8W777_9ANNE|nr:DgyrCDS11058 [Dimorphilus gyrociliatus]
MQRYRVQETGTFHYSLYILIHITTCVCYDEDYREKLDGAPPVIGNNSPSFLLGKEGQNIELWCSATGSPEPQLTWLKDGNEVLSSEDIIVDGNKIRLNNLKREDGGAYQCVFKNVVGQASHTIKLIIKGYVYIMEKPRNITVQDGNEAKFICHADNEFHNSTFKWYKDNVDVQLVPGLGTLRSSILSDGTLIIRNVIKSDSAWFECEAKNEISTSAKAKAFLNVTYLPVVLTSDMTVLLPRNMPGLLSCPFDANPPVTSVVWTKNEQEIKFLDYTRVYKRNLSDLAFRTVRESDEGAYSCTPYSALGASKYSPRFQVHIRDPPYFKERPKRYYQKQVGDTISIPCEATGDPTPTIKWQKQNGQLDPEKKLIEDSRLVITYLSMDDSGYYECEASNEVATIVTTTLLIVEVSSPHRARNISIKTTENTANVKWLPAFDSDYAKRQDYFIWYREIEKNTKQNWTTIAVPDDYTSLLVENLKSDTRYEFVILSRNSLGNGLFSERHLVKTKGSKRHITKTEVYPSAAIAIPPPGPRPDSPRNLTIKNLGDTLEIRWLPPRNLTVPVQYYIVYFRTVGKFDDLSGPINNGTSFEWKGFSRGAKYRFKVFRRVLHSISLNFKQ